MRRIHASTLVAADAGRVALSRGPFVYCVEGVDVPVPAHAVVLDRDADLTPVAALDGPVPCLAGPAWAETRAAADTEQLYFAEPAPRERIELTAVPYHAWNNRGVSTMAVWLREG